MSGIVKLKAVSGTTVRLKVTHAANSLIAKSGSVALSSGDTSKAVTFTTVMTSSDYLLQAWITNETDTYPASYPITRHSVKNATGFTVNWDVPLDSDNYILNWHVILKNNP